MESQSTTPPGADATPTSSLQVMLAWLYVGVPLAWGVSQTFIKALALFQ
ncbi:MFS transporter small subunit [Hymenobacter algoricola]|uniref:Oxalate:formate antiporter n=1 Tax=Hymenobacter algoricola TaxID=486267 RepID=A0ABP7N067_9BACT